MPAARAVPGARVWMHADHLGTPRVKTNLSGAVIAKSRLNYHPFGELVNPPPDAVKYKFTAKERDNESNLDYFGARHYGSHLGRFTAVDPALKSGRLEDPQSWNRYAYTRNNPLRYVDPNGEDWKDFLLGTANGLSSSMAFNLNRVDARTQNRDFQVGQVLGDVLAAAAGAAQVVTGLGGVGGGAAISATGAGAVAGVPAAAASAALVASGPTTATIGLSNAAIGGVNLVFSKPGSYAPGGDFSQKTKREAAENAGKKCEYCGQETVPARKSERGVTPPRNEGQTDHFVPKSRGGTNDPANARHVCRECNIKKGDKLPDEQ